MISMSAVRVALWQVRSRGWGGGSVPSEYGLSVDGAEIGGHGRGHWGRAVAELDRADARRVTVEHDVAERHLRSRQRRPRADRHPVGRRILVEHVQRLVMRDPQAPALAHGEAVLAL